MVSAMLYRLTRQPDMVIGMGVAGRDSADTEGLIGFFVNVLPIRIQLDDDTEAGQLIDQINQRLLAALDRRDVPFDMVVRNDMDRFHLVADVIDRVPQLGSRAAYLKQWLRDRLIEHRHHIIEHGVDMPEITQWRWGATADPTRSQE